MSGTSVSKMWRYGLMLLVISYRSSTVVSFSPAMSIIHNRFNFNSHYNLHSSTNTRYLGAREMTILSQGGNDDDAVVNSEITNEEKESPKASTTTTAKTTTTKAAPHRRRPRYSGRYPKNFSEKYKEHQGDEATISKVLAKGMTPAGSHVPIMVDECLHYLGLVSDYKCKDFEALRSKKRPFLAIDCTLGYGGHSSYIIKDLLDRNAVGSKLIGFDQDPIEIKKTDERLRRTIGDDKRIVLTTVNQNFETLGEYLSSKNQMGKVDILLADLGLSSMKIDNDERGFTYKRSGPLDMRMNPNNTTQNAYDLLRTLKKRQIKKILRDNSDEEFAEEIANGLKHNSKVPKTTIELADRVKNIVRPLIIERSNGKKISPNHIKHQLDSTVARVMQAIRIEVNNEFESLDKLLEDLPNILAPGGRAVFLTFHSGEDRRVKKSMKTGFKIGVYEAWSRNVVRPSKKEKGSNPRSSCCKLRWAIRS